MDKQQARQIIRKTFESPFDKKRFTSFIKNLLNRIEEATFTYQGSYIPEKFRQYIKSLERIGKFSDGANSLDILVIILQKETSLERARTMQRNFIAWYLNGSRGGELKDAALVAYVSPDQEDWRFSLVKMDYKFDLPTPQATASRQAGKTKTGRMKVREEFNNFTVREDEPLEKEVAIDPELLGKAYEKFNAIRPDNFDEFQKALKSGRRGDENKFNKKFGVYYTPREIVHYMCKQSLINYLHTRADEAKLTSSIKKTDIEDLIEVGEMITEHEATALIKQEKIKNGIQKSTEYTALLSDSIRENAAAIDRWLEEITVCDPAVGSGAFPVGMMNEIVRARNVLSVFLNNKQRSDYEFKRRCIEHSLYGVDIDPGAVEIAKLRLWLSLVVDEEDIKNIKPLPNLDYKIVCGNSLLGVEKDLFNNQLFNELEQLKPLFFNETNPTKKQEYKKQIDDLIHKITNGHTEFDFEAYFSEVFHNKGGFDVVIANPPYVKEAVNRHAFDGLRDAECYQGKMDLWYLFGSRGIDILKSNGAMCFIATNNWISNDGASKFRDKVVAKTRIIDFIDFGGHKIFAAGIQTMVFVLKKKEKPKKYLVNYGRLINEHSSLEIIEDFLKEKKELSCQYYTKFSVLFDRSEFSGKYISFVPPTIGKILNKLTSIAKFHLNDDEIFSGIDVMQDFVTKRHIDRLGDNVSIGDGVFVLRDSEKKSVIWNKSEHKLLKPYYTTKEIKRYYANRKNRFWVIYTGKEVNKNIDKYPNIRKHLDKFQSIITSVNKPYGLHRTRNEAIFLGHKVLATRKCARPTFSFVGFPCYFSRAFLAVKSNRINLIYLLAILNSKLIAFWFFYKGKLQGNQFQIDKVPLMTVPILNTSRDKQALLIRLVDKILAITKDADYLENPAKQAQVKEYERQIDQLVYEFYGLTEEEIKIVECDTK